MPDSKKKKNESLKQSVAAIDDLRELLHLSDDVANRLKMDIPGDRFPVAYRVSRSIRKLRKELELLRQTMGDDDFEIDFTAFSKDLISSSDSIQ